MKLHQYCEMIPPMSKTEYARLKDSIKRKGLLVPIVLLSDEILDGRHRYQACKELDFVPETVQYTGDDPFGYAVSLNATRRHLNQSQRALLATNMATLKQGEAGNGRKVETQIRVSTPTIKQASKALGVSTTTIDAAKKLKSTATSSVIKAVENGSITINAAQKVTDNTESEILIKATPAQVELMAKTVGERVEVRIAKITHLAKQLRSEYDSLSRYEQNDAVITAFHDVDFELGLIAQIKSNKTKAA